MWPKALAQLIELAPHITRLIPMADRFLQSKTAGEEASRVAMQQMTEGLRGELGQQLGQVTASHAGLYRQLNEQSTKLTALGTDLHSARLAAESAEARTIVLEQQVKTLRTLVLVVLLFAVVLLTLLILLTIRK